MICYQALSTYQILECIEHRILINPDDDAVLILGDYIIERFPNYKRLENFFSQVALFRYGGYKFANTTLLCEQIENEFLKAVGVNLTEIEKFYIAGIHTYLQVAMVMKEISFEMFEDGSGALSRPWILADIHKKDNVDRYNIINEFGLYNHDLDIITRKWCDFSAQTEDFYDPKAVDFNVVENFTKLPNIIQNSILDFFGISKKIPIRDADILLLTQQFSNLGQLSFEEHVQIYQHLFDYYDISETNVVIKTHPDDIMYYRYLFPNTQIVDKKFPSELLPFAFEKVPETIATISSTGVNLIKHRFKQRLIFNDLYENSFKYDYLYYTLVQIFKLLDITTVNTYSVNDVQLMNLYNRHNMEGNSDLCLSSEKEKFVVIDDINRNDLILPILRKRYSEKDFEVLFFLNSRNSYMYLDSSLMESFTTNIAEIHISNNGGDDNYQINERHYIWIFTNNMKIKERINNYRMRKKLSNTGNLLEAKILAGHEKEIKMLRGRLTATEERLKRYLLENSNEDSKNNETSYTK